jgi:hypothetical protein
MRKPHLLRSFEIYGRHNCDVIIQRWQDLSGRHATLEGDGGTFEQIKTARLGVAA